MNLPFPSPFDAPRGPQVRSSLVRFFVTGICLFSISSICVGDILQLKNGGRIEGELLNPDEAPREKYVVRLADGGEVTVNVDQVEKFVSLSDSEKLYRKLLNRMPETAVGNWKMAQWCRDNGLREQRTFHLEEAIRLDPDHETARRALGFKRLGGKWTTQEAFMTDRGFVRFEGRWRLPQEVAILKQRSERELAVKKWAQDIKRWRKWLGTKRDQEARQNFASIDDVLAADGLAHLLAKEQHPEVQTIYINALGKLPTQVATKSLIRTVLSGCTDEIRYRCLDYLEDNGRELAIDAFIKVLDSSDNLIIRRAGVGLTRLQHPRAIRPLIEALVSEHKVVLSNGSPGQLSTAFGGQTGGGAASGTGGLSFGAGGGPKVEVRLLQNPEVLAALVKLVGGPNFLYDQDAWRQWYIEQSTPLTLDLRRGA